MLKELLKLQILPFINPFIYDEIERMGEYSGVNNSINRETPLIVSLSSSKKNYKNLPIVLFSLLNQSLKPDNVILWLDEETEDLTTLPYEITRFIKNGLEIRFIKNLNLYTNTICALEEFKNGIIVTACDNMYYRKNWLKRLYYSYIASPNDIHIHNALSIKIINNSIASIQKWEKVVNSETAKYTNFPITAGGILYPPNCFKKEAFRSDIFLKYAPQDDDVWFWIMAVINNKKFRVVKNHDKSLVCLNIFDYITGMKTKNVSFDLQIDALMKLYGQNVISKL